MKVKGRISLIFHLEKLLFWPKYMHLKQVAQHLGFFFQTFDNQLGNKKETFVRWCNVLGAPYKKTFFLLFFFIFKILLAISNNYWAWHFFDQFLDLITACLLHGTRWGNAFNWIQKNLSRSKNTQRNFH